jgi:crotonobetainyl-CoA:carnitine CoA-transferase CaiB-like acyl-CoA transferase
MREVLRLRAAEEWLARFQKHDVPAQRVLTPAQAAASPQAVVREMVVERDGERHIPFPVWANGRRGAALDCTAPACGADGAAILAELGFERDEIACLEESGALGALAPA